jgi:hypothetical protein
LAPGEFRTRPTAPKALALSPVSFYGGAVLARVAAIVCGTQELLAFIIANTFVATIWLVALAGFARSVGAIRSDVWVFGRAGQVCIANAIHPIASTARFATPTAGITIALHTVPSIVGAGTCLAGLIDHVTFTARNRTLLPAEPLTAGVTVAFCALSVLICIPFRALLRMALLRFPIGSYTLKSAWYFAALPILARPKHIGWLAIFGELAA